MCHNILAIGLQDVTLDALVQITQRKNIRIVPVFNLDGAIWMLGQRRFSLIVIDLTHYANDAAAFLRKVKGHAPVPVIALGAIDDRHDWPAEWEVHLFLARAMPPQQIASRIITMLRSRADNMDYTRMDLTMGQPIEQGDFFVDPAAESATVCGKTVLLAPEELGLLNYLLLHPRQILTYREISTVLWVQPGGYGRDEAELINILRGKIEPDPANPIYIQTVPGIGYWFRNTQ